MGLNDSNEINSKFVDQDIVQYSVQKLQFEALTYCRSLTIGVLVGK